ncbi:MAG: hypothetical protein QM817_07845 [Archangium sp.]
MGSRFITAGIVFALALCGCEEVPSVEDAGPPVIVPPPRTVDCLRLPETLDFGEVERGDSRELSFVLNNNTLKTIAIEVGAVDAPFTINLVGNQPVDPGRPVTLRFLFEPPDGRTHVATVNFRGGLGCTPQVLSLSGRGAGEVVGPSFVDLGPLPVGLRSSKSVSLSNSRRETVQLTLMLSQGQFDAPTSLTIPALGAANLEIGATITSLGPIGGSIEITSDHGDHLFMSLSASGGLPDLRSDRSSIRIDRLPMSNDATTFPLFQRSVTLSNRGEGTLRLSSATLQANAGSAIDEVKLVLFNNFLAPDAATTLLVQLQPHRTPGPRSWTILLASDQPDLPVLEIPITAEVVLLPNCAGTVFSSPVALDVMASALPMLSTVTIHNPASQDCLIDDIRFVPPVWSLAPPIEQLLVPARGDASLQIDLDRAGAATLIFNPVGAELGYSTVQVRAQ